jgi:hypothetical protein
VENRQANFTTTKSKIPKFRYILDEVAEDLEDALEILGKGKLGS